MTQSVVGGERPYRWRKRRRQVGERGGIEALAHRAHLALAGNDESVVEFADAVHRSFAGDGFAAFAETRQRGNIPEDAVRESNLRKRTLFVADDDGSARDVFEAALGHPELVRVTPVDVDRRGYVAERVVNQRQLRLVFADGGVALAIESGVKQRELPGRRGLFRQDRVTAALEMQVLGLVAHHVDAGEAGANAEVHVAEKRMLRHAKAYGHGGGIAAADLEVDITHRRVEGAGVGVGNVVIRRNLSRRRKRDAKVAEKAAGAETGEHHHDAYSGLEPRRAGREEEDRPVHAEADDAHAGPDVDRMVEAIAAFGHKHNAFTAVAFGFVDGSLERGGGIGAAVGPRAKLRRVQVDGPGIVEPGGQDRLRERGRDRAQQQCIQQSSFHEISAASSIPSRAPRAHGALKHHPFQGAKKRRSLS